VVQDWRLDLNQRTLDYQNSYGDSQYIVSNCLDAIELRLPSFNQLEALAMKQKTARRKQCDELSAIKVGATGHG
jgi:hypothetical protein